MHRSKIFDCITFYNENFLTNLRFEILDNVVDYFIICESKFDHKGNPKPINFFLKNKKFEKKIRHIVIEEQFPNLSNGWFAEEFQREKLFDGIKDASDEDYIIYSDSDEIPNPEKLINFDMNKKFGIFLQDFFVYKINIFNKFETPWEGSRICKKKNLRSFNYLRKKILKKNISKPFWKINTEKNIELIFEGGWHFNNLYDIEIISKKIKTFPHIEFNKKEYSDINMIKKRLDNLEDIFGRGYKFEKININKRYPEYILKNLDIFKKYIE